MKILILSDDFLPDSDVVGGASVVTHNFATSLKKLGHEVSVISASKDKMKCGLFNVGGISVERLHSLYHEDRWRSYRSLYNPGLLKSVEKTIKNTRPDVVWAHSVHMYLSYHSLFVAKRQGAKVFVTVHDVMPFYPGTFTEFIDPKELSCPQTFNYRPPFFSVLKKFRFRYNPFRNLLIRFYLRRVDGVIAVSEALKEALGQNGIKNVSVIKNGIDLSDWHVSIGDVDNFKEKFNCRNLKTVLFGGRLSGGKGGDIIIDVMSLLVKNIPNVCLLIAGKKDFYAKKMEEKIIKNGLSNNVVFMGWLGSDDMKKAYAVSSVVVIPSVCFDSFPNTNLEAFAASRPVVATCFGGSKEIVRNGQNGYIVNPFNITIVAGSISDLLMNEEKAKKFGENGRILVDKEFTLIGVINEYLSIFSK